MHKHLKNIRSYYALFINLVLYLDIVLSTVIEPLMTLYFILHIKGLQNECSLIQTERRSVNMRAIDCIRCLFQAENS